MSLFKWSSATLIIMMLNTPVFADRIKVAIMDFTTVDIEADKYLRHTDKVSVQGNEELLTPAQRAMLSEEELKEYAKAEVTEKIRIRQEADAKIKEENDRNRKNKENHRARMVASSLGRKTIIGADLLASELSSYSHLFSIVDRKTLEESLVELEFQRSGLVSSDTQKQLGQMTGASHLIYGVVDDLRQEERQFSGYGIKTNNIVKSLDLTIRVVELSTGEVVFNKEFTHEISEIKTQFSSHSDTGEQKKLMKGAIKKAAEGMKQRFAPISSSMATTPSLPKVTMAPVNENGKPINANIFIDGKWKGNTPTTMDVPSGTHTLKISAVGYQDFEVEIEFANGMNLTPPLQKK